MLFQLSLKHLIEAKSLFPKIKSGTLKNCLLDSDNEEEKRIDDFRHLAKHGKELPDLSPKSMVRLPNHENLNEEKLYKFEAQEEINKNNEASFLYKMHHIFYHLLLNESHLPNKLDIMKTLCWVVQKTPYSKLPYGLVTNTILPFVNESFLNKNKTPKMVSKQRARNDTQLKQDLQIVHLVKALLSVRELKLELNDSVPALFS